MNVCRHRGDPHTELADVYLCHAFGDVDTACTCNEDAVDITIEGVGPILRCGPGCNFYDPPRVKARKRK